MTATEKRQCSEKVYPYRLGLGLPYPCHKPAVVERDGKWYCKIHDPEYIKQKTEKTIARIEAGLERDRLRYARIDAVNRATEGLTTDELKALTPALLRKAIPMRDALEDMTFAYRRGFKVEQAKAYNKAMSVLAQAKEGKE